VFVGGVLNTRSAWVMDLSPFVARVRAGAEVSPSPRLASVLTRFLMKRQTVITKKRRGPAPTGKGTLVGVRLQPAQLEALDAWIAKQNQRLTRPEAIRAMMETILHILSKDTGEKPAKKGKRK
jgi:hypothetical protein